MLKLLAVNLTLGSKQVLHNISFTLSKGEFIGIIGPNGAGKSSLLRLIQGALVPNGGQILFQDNNLSELSAFHLAKKLAVVDQNTAPFFNLTVLEVATMGLLPHKRWYELDNEDDKKNVLNALSKVGLVDKLQQEVETLSGGELQRLHIARALVQNPILLLLDEPTNHLDVQYQHHILQLVKKLNIPVIACLHDLNLAAIYCDKLLIINEGEQIAFGKVDEVLTPSIIEQVFDLACEVNFHPALNKLQVTFLPYFERNLC